MDYVFIIRTAFSFVICVLLTHILITSDVFCQSRVVSIATTSDTHNSVSPSRTHPNTRTRSLTFTY